jgi:hypothetical protein
MILLKKYYKEIIYNMEVLLNLNSKLINKLDTINQVAKNFFEEYFIKGNIIFPKNKKSCLLDIGEHYLILPNELIIPELINIDGYYILFSSQDVYKCKKNHKTKEMININIDENNINILLTDNSMINIGRLVDWTYLNDRFDLPILKNNQYNAINDIIMLKQDIEIMDLLINNEVTSIAANINNESYIMRVYRTILPVFKKKDSLSIGIRDKTEYTFEGLFITKKDESGILAHSIYTFVKY